MNTRRSLVMMLGAAAAMPQVLFAQAKKPPVLIGWLSLGTGGPGTHSLGAFKEGLTALGWKEGTQFVVEGRWADGHNDRLALLARELAAREPALIVASPMRVAVIATKAAPRIPVVVVSGLDPVAGGLVTSLARPGGMITGLTGFGPDLAGKHVELLLAAAPKVKRVGFLADSGNPNHVELMNVARRAVAQYQVEARVVEVERPEEIQPAIERLAKEGAQGLVVLPSGIYARERRLRMLKFALAQRWPVVATARAWAEDGALLSYGADTAANYRRAAWYVDRILKGAKPGDLPIEQPTTFELVVNMKTAKALGLTMPPEIMVRVDKVIE
jgi:putative ABC transport system substrate-binding protein